LTHTLIQGGSNMTGTYAACLHRNQSRSYLNHPVHRYTRFVSVWDPATRWEHNLGSLS